MSNFKLLSLICLSGLILQGCGKHETNPIKDYEQGVVPYQEVRVESELKNSFYSIKNSEGLNFIENEEKSVQFNVELFYENPSEVDYNLTLTENAFIKSKLKRSATNPNAWILTWKPKANITSQLDGRAKFKIGLEFTLTSKSSAGAFSALAGITAGKNYPTEFDVSVSRSSDQPIIEKIMGFSPGPVANPGQELKIGFVVSTRLNKSDIDQLEITAWSGPELPTPELIRMNALSGLTSVSPRFIKFLPDQNGRTFIQYEYVFNSQPFIDHILHIVNKHPQMKSRFDSGEITEAEAQFNIVAKNKYSGDKSLDKLVNFKVNLLGKAVPASIAGYESIEVIKGGSESNSTFFIRSGDERSQLQILGISLASQELVMDKDSTTADINNVSINIDCSGGTAGLSAVFNCKIGDCFKMCKLQATANCAASENIMPLVFHTESRWGQDILTQELKYSVKIKSNPNCSVSAAPSEAKHNEGVN